MDRTNEAHFMEFAADVGPALHRRAFLLTGDHHLAQDLVQTTYLKLYTRWKRLIRWESPQAYAQRVLYTTFCEARRRRWTAEIPTGYLPEKAAPADNGHDQDLASALRTLPPRQRAVVVARFYDDLSVEQTATLLGVATGTVKSQTARALDKLRAALDVPPTTRESV